MTDYGVNLRRLRGDRSLQQTAQALNITVEALRAYESGKRRPRDEVRARIRRVLGGRL